jgi:transcriptional regulator with PAS, ATPase and Fis domain
MQRLYDSKLPLLIYGETGTGKTQLAKKIHKNSIYKTNQFVKCNLAGLSDSLFDSELFGHIKGAFTGAIADKLGYCELVSEGTLFFDEVGELTLNQQKKLLNILDDHRFKKVGCIRDYVFKGRFIFATHRDLKQMVVEGNFREDLYFRIGGNPISLRPFRTFEKDKKIEIILKKIDEINSKYMSPKCMFTEVSIEHLANYNWPGNFRELERTLEFLILKSERNIIELRDLPATFNTKLASRGALRDQIYDLERKVIKNEVVNRGIGINKASKSLGISKTTLIAKMRKYGITVHHNKMENIRVA